MAPGAAANRRAELPVIIVGHHVAAATRRAVPMRGDGPPIGGLRAPYSSPWRSAIQTFSALVSEGGGAAGSDQPRRVMRSSRRR